MMSVTKSGVLTVFVLVLLGTVPLGLYNLGHDYMGLATRLVCLAMAAASLNLILGYGGMVSFGHAVFIGIGAYAVGIPAYHATYGDFDLIASYSGGFHIVMAMIFSGIFALITGAISLRTKGIHFIMITMAFSQMIFFFFVSLETYGGDDGLTIDVRSEVPLINLDNPIHMFFVAFAFLVLTLFLMHKIVNSRFGMVLRGAKDNEERMKAIGYNTFAYRLTAYFISGVLCGLSGALLANSEAFVFPEMIDWTRSGELIFMVLLGGSGTLIGPVIGAIVFVAVEHFLPIIMNLASKGSGIYWHLPFGIMLVLAVLYARKGLVSLILPEVGDDASHS